MALRQRRSYLTRSGRASKPPALLELHDDADQRLDLGTKAGVAAEAAHHDALALPTTPPQSPKFHEDDSSVKRRYVYPMSEPRVMQRSHRRSSIGQAVNRTWQRQISPRIQRLSRRGAAANRRERTNTWRLIPSQHPLKILWDVITMVISFCHVYATHTAIRDRQFHQSFFRFCEVWFVLDMVLNFCTARTTSEGKLLSNVTTVWARYLTTWFVIDVIALIPGESLFVQPLIDQQNRRHWLRKSIFRTTAVLRVTRILRQRHVRLFGQLAKTTKQTAGVGAHRLLRLFIKYLPKYWLFCRRMKGLVAVRALRHFHWCRKVWNSLMSMIRRPRHDKSEKLAKTLSHDDDTLSLTDHGDFYEFYRRSGGDGDDDDDNDSDPGEIRYHGRRPSPRFDDWEFVEESHDDDVDDDLGPY